MPGDFRHGQFKCDQCEVSTKDLETPWHLLNQKPLLRTEHSMKQCAAKWKESRNIVTSKGVVDAGLFVFLVSFVVPHFVHVFNGIFNKIYSITKARLMEVVDEPYMARSSQGLHIAGRLAILDSQQKEISNKLAALEKQLEILRETKIHLKSYLTKLQNSSSKQAVDANRIYKNCQPQQTTRQEASQAKKQAPNYLKSMRGEMQQIEKDIRNNAKQQQAAQKEKTNLQAIFKKISHEMQELSGPMAQTVRKALRELDVELTMYWPGQFVGPQIDKLMDAKKYLHIFNSLQKKLEEICPQMTSPEIEDFEVLVAELLVVWTQYFELRGCVKVTHQLSKQEIDHIESVIEKFSISFRRTTQFVLSSKKKGKRGVSKAVPPKFHTLEAHLVPFLREYNAGWPYSEEGIESSHH